jgi:aspartate-semialdehyde dehydrogenase
LAKSDSIKIAILGGETLLGRELQEVLGSRMRGAEIVTFAAGGEGNFAEEEGEALYVQPLSAQNIQDFKTILVAGSLPGALKTYELAKGTGRRPVVVDCTGYLEAQPEARIVAPLIADTAADSGWLLVIAHPAASALALVLSRLAKYGRIRQAVVHIFEPASERGKRGISELHRQTSSLLSFKALDNDIFDAQLSFNLLSQYGEEAPVKLAAVERRIERDFATIIAKPQPRANFPVPSLRLIQAPVFHGYSFSIWVEFESAIEAQALREGLASAQIEVRGEAEEAPHPAGMAGQSGLIAGDIRIDGNNAHAAWIWVAGDNLRLMADAAADLLSDQHGTRQ